MLRSGYMTVRKPYLIGITGGSASGKTRFLQSVAHAFKPHELSIVSQDNYYKPALHHVLDTNGHINYDLPECIDLDKLYGDMQQLANGNSIQIQEYRFQHEEQYGHTISIHSAPIIIIEGLFLFYNAHIKSMFDLKVFVEAEEHVQYKRRYERDTKERNIPAEFVKYQWENHVMPAYSKYLLPYRNEADLIINNNTHFEQSLLVMQHHIQMVLKS